MLCHLARCNRQLVEAAKAGRVVLAPTARQRSGSVDAGGALFHGSGSRPGLHPSSRCALETLPAAHAHKHRSC